MTEQETRIAILGAPNLHYADAVDNFRIHIAAQMQFPFQATGREPFNWEVPFLSGEGSAAEYERLKRSGPSHKDQFQLMGLEDGFSTWMRYQEEDITVHARRINDGRDFWLGLAELRAVETGSPNHQLIEDYVSFVRSRS